MAFRPSQAHKRTVTMGDGRTVTNAAYKPTLHHTHHRVPSARDIVASTGISDESIHLLPTAKKMELASAKRYADILYRDKDVQVRIAVADAGYHLDDLVRDSRPEVRAAVARHSHYHMALADDSSAEVAKVIAQATDDARLIARYVHSPFTSVRSEVAKRWDQYHDELSHDSSPLVVAEVANNTMDDTIIERLSRHPNAHVRYAVASGYHPPRHMVNDEDSSVRVNLALHGWYIDQLSKDQSPAVRAAVKIFKKG